AAPPRLHGPHQSPRPRPPSPFPVHGAPTRRRLRRPQTRAAPGARLPHPRPRPRHAVRRQARGPPRCNGTGPRPAITTLERTRIVTTILAPPTTATSTADQIINVLPTYADEHQLDTRGGHPRTMPPAALIGRLSDLPVPRARH